jgi:hypothetical protein
MAVGLPPRHHRPRDRHNRNSVPHLRREGREGVSIRARRGTRPQAPGSLSDLESRDHRADPERLCDRLAEADRPSPALRARVRVKRGSLDAQLAEGADPLRDAALALRARQLVSRHTREQFATGLEGLVSRAERPPLPRAVAVPLPRRQILEARTGLLDLASCLRAERPLYARGMALLSWLLTNGSGPVYRAGADGALPDALEAVAEALDGASPDGRLS